MNVEELPLVLDAGEAAGALRVSKWALYQAIKRGEVRVLRVGRAIRVPRAELVRLLGEEPVRDEDVPKDVQVVTTTSPTATTGEGVNECFSETPLPPSTEEFTCRLRAARVDLEDVIAGRLPGDREVLEGIATLLRAAEERAA